MQIKKQILIFYVLVLASAGVIIAAEQPGAKQPGSAPASPCQIKCCKTIPSATPLPSLKVPAEGFMRYKA